MFDIKHVIRPCQIDLKKSPGVYPVVRVGQTVAVLSNIQSGRRMSGLSQALHSAEKLLGQRSIRKRRDSAIKMSFNGYH